MPVRISVDGKLPEAILNDEIKVPLSFVYFREDRITLYFEYPSEIDVTVRKMHIIYYDWSRDQDPKEPVYVAKGTTLTLKLDIAKGEGLDTLLHFAGFETVIERVTKELETP